VVWAVAFSRAASSKTRRSVDRYICTYVCCTYL
jgi:hypothetical protein